MHSGYEGGYGLALELESFKPDALSPVCVQAKEGALASLQRDLEAPRTARRPGRRTARAAGPGGLAQLFGDCLLEPLPKASGQLEAPARTGDSARRGLRRRLGGSGGYCAIQG